MHHFEIFHDKDFVLPKSSGLEVLKCSTSSITREVQIKNNSEILSHTPAEWLRSKTQVTAHAGEDVKQGGTLLHCWSECKLVQPLWKSIWWFLRKLDIVLLEDPAIPLLDIYPEEVPIGNKNTCSTMFIVALFIIARSWKEPRCPSTEECMQKLWYFYTMEYYSAIKNNGFIKFLDK